MQGNENGGVLNAQERDKTKYEGDRQERIEDGRGLDNQRTAFFSVFRFQKMELLPILMMIGIVPLVVRVEILDVAKELRKFGANAMVYDIYSYGKSVVILALDIVMLLFLARFSREKREFVQDHPTKKILYGLFLFSALAILSTIFSNYKNVAIWGSPERDEGILMILSYVWIVIYSLFVLRDVSAVKHIRSAVFFVAAMMSILALSDKIYGKDMLYVAPLSYMVIPSYLEGFDYGSSGDWISLTLYNPNFVGSFCALMIPMLFVMSRDKSASSKIRWFSFVLFCSSLWILFVSRSQAGMVGVMLSAFVGLYYFVPALLKNKRFLAIFLGALCVGAVALDHMTGGEAWFHIKDIFVEGAKLVSQDEDYVYDPTYGAYLYDVIIEGKVATVRTRDGDLRVFFGKNSADIVDMEGRSVLGEQETVVENGVETIYTLLHEPYDSVRVMEEYEEEKQHFSIVLEHEGKVKFLLNHDQKGEVYLSSWSKERLDMVTAPHWGFEGKERIGSGRGYIWSRTIPMLKETILIGHGPDNYMMAFPQGDYLAKNKFNPENPFIVIDKPHNMYLQWAVNEGVIATLALLFSLGYYLVSSMKLYRRKREYTLPELFGIGCMLSVIGYMGAGFFNDSVVSVAPIFWSFFGAGVAVNALVRRELVDRI